MGRRTRVAAFAVIAAILMATAPPADASTGAFQSGENDTAAELSAGSLTEFEPRGSGASGYLLAEQGSDEYSVSGTSVPRGYVDSYSTGSWDDPGDPAVEFTGAANTETDTGSGAVSPGETISQVAGNADAGDTDVTLSVGSDVQATRNAINYEGDSIADSHTAIWYASQTNYGRVGFEAHETGTLESIRLPVYSFDATLVTFNVYIEPKPAVDGAGTGPDSEVFALGHTHSGGDLDIPTTNEINVEKGTRYVVYFVPDGSDSDDFDTLEVETDTSANVDAFYDPFGGEIEEEHADIETTISYGSSATNVQVKSGTDTLDLGSISPGGSKSGSVATQPGDSVSVHYSGAGQGVDASWATPEKTVTEDPGLIVNGDDQGQLSGTLQAGSTSTLDVADSAVDENSENSIEVTMAGLTADAPEPRASFSFSHTATSSWSSAEYAGSPHSVANATKTEVDVSAASNASGTVYAEYNDGTGWAQAGSESFTSAGTVTVDYPTITGSEQVRTRVTATPAQGKSVVEIGAERVYSERGSPSVEQTQPSDGSQLNDENVRLEVSVDDPDFGSPAGDSIDGTIYVDGSPAGTLDARSSQGTGAVTVQGLAEGQHTWYVEAEDSYGLTGASPTRSFTVNHHAPQLSGGGPQGSVSEASPNLQIEVTDRDFAESSGDTVTVDFYLNGQLVGSNTTSSNGTVSYAGASPEGGSNTWKVSATDEYGKTANSSFSFRTPDSLSIYNETDRDQIVNSAEVQLGFYFDRDGQADLIETRNTSDGTVDMTGLPVDEPFVVTAKADGYFTRRIWVPSLYESQRVYLLNETADAVQPTFKLVDFTGRYPRDTTVLEIQRNINGTWRTVEGDYFGAGNRMGAQLAYNVRHRMIVTHVPSGRSRDLGVYTPTTSTIIELEVNADDEVIGAGTFPTVEVRPGIRTLPAEQVDLTAVVAGNTSALQAATVEAYANGTRVYSSSTSSAGNTSFTADLRNRSGERLVVWVNWTTAEASQSVDAVYTIRESRSTENAILPLLAGAALGGEPPTALSALLVMIGGVLATGFAATKMSGGSAALMGVGVVAAGAVIGWVPMTWLVALFVTFAALAALRSQL